MIERLIVAFITLYLILVAGCTSLGATYALMSIEDGKDDPDYISGTIALKWCLLPITAFKKVLKYRDQYFNGGSDKN